MLFDYLSDPRCYAFLAISAACLLTALGLWLDEPPEGAGKDYDPDNDFVYGGLYALIPICIIVSIGGFQRLWVMYT